LDIEALAMREVAIIKRLGKLGRFFEKFSLVVLLLG